MIQPLNTVNLNTYQKQNTNFGDTPKQQSIAEEKAHKPSRAKAIAAYSIGQFAAGAIISSILNIGGNIVEKLKKVPDKTKIIPSSGIAKQAAIMGGLFVLIGLVINSVFTLLARKKSGNN